MKSKSDVVLGIDTSCYTTSFSLVTLENEILLNEKIQLKVKNATTGLRQSEAVYQHVNNLGKIFSKVKKYKDNYNIKAICVSTKPRPVENSYMPVFNVGYNFANAIADILDVPIYKTTHQEGHIQAGYVNSNMTKDKFICVHISGGTSEILLVNKNKSNYSIDIIGASKDISAGQLIDRIGVKLGYPFPCGKYLDNDSISFEKCIDPIKISVNEGYINFSGVETKLYSFIGQYEKEYISKLTLDCISKSLLKSLLYLCRKYDINDVLFVGGVSSSKYISLSLTHDLGKNGIKAYWTKPEYATDNAVGVALIGAETMHCGDE
ncbi:N6-L-threonylcarbamoyladenine synthase [Alkalithermobacter thermoalcaliphilus JW-YL-7 = DSM 7308]|uniref:N(6)-L-threonylcarbamoyladenine synthase n=1 Tax=Alkalithermobacter thermoalcaliphilus JW-YL-7 = DSM 7308 TaxID=1121328 RepID=A0A150FPU2_CLOPD|nr:peptidase M22 glycoprotease [[Clostridium] paradoxum JW-YL-7 = DSM 7308]SHK66285.1 N6-L-threonylcarbamoyladenine synthase [[Clostridium] paradoxum JW-YL-7 = DSM 7308]